MFGGEQGNSSSVLVPTRFVWPHGGRVVQLCGTFTGWQDTIAMLPVEGAAGVFAVVVPLPPGYPQYKFIVDNEWRHDDQQPAMVDPMGNINNWMHIKEPEPPLHTIPPAQQAVPSSLPETSIMEVDSPHVHMPPTHLPRPLTIEEPLVPEPVDLPLSDFEPSRQRVADFLQRHTAYELLPESGKVVALDISLPVKQAFHALHEQGVPAAPLWDAEKQDFVGILSASDFITILRQLRSNGSMLSEEELETHTIAAWKDEKISLSLATRPRQTKPSLIAVHPDHSLRHVANQLLHNNIATVPVICDEAGVPQLLHLASLTGVLRCIWRHFRPVQTCLPLLSQPIGLLPIGTWASETKRPNARQLTTVRASDPLTTALLLLLNAGVSSLPVLDDSGAVVDVYARSDITSLARDRVYTQRQLDEFTVQEALMYRESGTTGGPTNSSVKCHMCLRTDKLHVIIERLSVPGARRLICVEPGSKHIEGIISLTDIFQFLLA